MLDNLRMSHLSLNLLNCGDNHIPMVNSLNVVYEYITSFEEHGDKSIQLLLWKTFVGNVKKHFIALWKTFQIKWEHILKFHMKGWNWTLVKISFLFTLIYDTCENSMWTKYSNTVSQDMTRNKDE
jgi:hypothetical protein